MEVHAEEASGVVNDVKQGDEQLGCKGGLESGDGDGEPEEEGGEEGGLGDRFSKEVVGEADDDEGGDEEGVAGLNGANSCAEK